MALKKQALETPSDTLIQQLNRVVHIFNFGPDDQTRWLNFKETSLDKLGY